MSRRTFRSFVKIATTFLALTACDISSAGQLDAIPIARDIYRLDGTMANCVFIAGADGVLLVDSSESVDLARAMKAAIATVSDKPVDYLVNTHCHFDHVNGNPVFAACDATIIAHSSVRSRLEKAEANAGKLPPEAWPQICFDDDLTIFFDDDVVYILHPGTHGAHTDGDIVVFFSRGNVLSAGDLFFNGSYPYIDVGCGGWITGMAASIRKVLDVINDKTIVVPGHGPISDKKGFAEYAAMLEDVGARIDSMMRKGMTLKEIQDAKPTTSWDGKYGRGFVTPDGFVEMAYESLVAHR